MHTLLCALACMKGALYAEETRSDEATNGKNLGKKAEEKSEELSATGMADMVVIASRTAKPWIESNGSVTSVRAGDFLREGVFDIGGIAKYDPLLSAPFDFSSSDTLYGYAGSGYTGFNIRGAEGNRISMEVDGIRIPPQYVSTSFDMGSAGGSGGMGRDYFDPAMFNLVEIYKGGGSALYGSDAMGGVITMRTLDAADLLGGKEYGGFLRGQYFSVNDLYAQQIGGAWEKGGFRMMLLYAGREGHETGNQGGARYAPNPVDFYSDSVLGKFDYSAGDHRFQLTLESFLRDADVNTLSAVANSTFGGFNDYVYNYQRMERQRASFRWEFEPLNGWFDKMEAQAYWQSSSNRSANRSANKDRDMGGVIVPGRKRRQTIEFDTDIVGLTYQARKELKKGSFKHQLLGGVDLSMEHGESTFARMDTSIVADRNRTPFAPSDVWRFGLYLQDEIQIGDRWSFTPGLRADYQLIKPEISEEYRERIEELALNGTVIELAEEYENIAVSPRFDIAFKPTKESRIYGTYAMGIRNPTAEELSMVFVHPDSSGGTAGTVSLPNPDLQEEISHAFELGYKADGQLGRFQIAGFYTFYKDFIENNRFTGEYDDEGREINMSVNRGESVIYGAELSGELNFGHWQPAIDGWKIGGASGISIGRNETDGTWLNSVEPWKSSLFVGYDDPSGRYGARVTGTYVDKVRRVDDTIPQTGTLFRPPAYFLLDVSAYWKPREGLSLNAGVNNLLDEKYWSWAAGRRTAAAFGNRERSTAAGTNFYLSLSQTF